jgi:capsular polysaccharide biosynthesis protein/Mrp family chromosome partitioning ATPase
MDWRDWDEPRAKRPSEQDFGSLREDVGARKWRLIGAPVAALALIGVVMMLTTPKYRAEAQVLVRTTANASLSDPAVPHKGADESEAVKGQARLIASRDLARRAIKDLRMESRPEFDPMAEDLGPGARALILLGLMRDPARMSRDERILKSYEDRLSVEAPQGTGLVTIAFQSEDRELAAKAANRIADLYLEMRAKAAPEGEAAPDVRLVARAIAPAQPLFPNGVLILASGAAALFVTAFAALVFSAFRRARSIRAEAPVEQPRVLGQTPVFARLKDAGADAARRDGQAGPLPQTRKNAAASRAEADNAQAMGEIADRILSARRGAGRGARIVVTSLAAAQTAPQMMLALGRLLGREGRSIVVGLDRANAPDFSKRPAGAQAEAGAPASEPGLGDLLAGTASFEEVIHRDPASRLHFVPVGANEPIDLQEFAGVLETLARTYDFILLIAPPFDEGDLARTLAANADFVVLSAPPQPHENVVGRARAELMECGAHEVLVVGMPIRLSLSFGQDAA